MPRTKAPAQPNLSLLNGLQCLQQVVGATGPIGSREVARRVGLDHTRVNRLLGTLAYAGLLEQDHSRKYGPGPGLHVIAAQSMRASGLLQCALPVLQRLREGELTVALGVLWRDQVCYLFHERPWQSPEESILQHDLWPVQLSSLGIALLAAGEGTPGHFPPPVHARSVPLEPATEALEAARRDGYARLTFPDATVSLGITVGQPAIAAIAISGHLTEGQVGDAAARLREAAAEVDRNLAKLRAERRQAERSAS